MPCAAKEHVNTSHLSKDPLPPLQNTSRSGSKCTGGWGGPPGRSPSSSSLTSYNMSLPPATGSPFFHCPVPVAQGYTNPFPVDIHLKVSLACFWYWHLNLDDQVEMVKSTLAASVMFAFPSFFFFFFRWRRCFELCTCPFIVLLDSVMFYSKYMNNYVCLSVCIFVQYDLCCIKCLVCNSLFYVQ